ncbi:hypothetical protein JOQ06_019715 [Pogonophryne albipinna]|uniref:Uncharacterized protein n=1 Tax=Pogonophryne albipinna TaxID=1090488 RepID=A0AAD6BSI4_9TELE|nr:hypothetical protein JOQ06_019715 [Pogonophryne albipinna]
MMMDQLKVIQMTMQKIPGEPAGGPDPLGRDILPLKDITSLLALEKRLREEADLQNKMITALTQLAWHQWENSIPQTATERCHYWDCQKQQAHSDSKRPRGRILQNGFTLRATEMEVEERERNEEELSKKPAFKIPMGPVKEVDKSINKISRLFPCQDLVNNTRPSKCHNSMQHLGRMRIRNVGRIWARMKTNRGPD